MALSDSDALSVSSYLSLDDAEIPDPYCNGCNLAIQEGSVVSFGGHIWHVDCFRCTKCNMQINHNSNALLLFDGTPVCEKCSCSCKICSKCIDDFAIMTGCNETYHSECFRCNACNRKIEDLMFVKTNQGIYCLSCHNNSMEQNKAFEKGSQFPIAFQNFNKSLPSIPASSNSNQINSQDPVPISHDKASEKPYIDFPSDIVQTELLNINQLFPEFKNEDNSTSKNNSTDSSSIYPSNANLDHFFDFSKTTISSETEHTPKTENAVNDSTASSNSTSAFPNETSTLPSDFENSLLSVNYGNSSNAKDVLKVSKHIEKDSSEVFLLGGVSNFEDFDNIIDFFNIKDSQKSEQFHTLGTNSRNISSENNDKCCSVSLESDKGNDETKSKENILLYNFFSKHDNPDYFNMDMFSQKINKSSAHVINEASKKKDFPDSENHNKSDDLKKLDFVSSKNSYDNGPEISLICPDLKSTSSSNVGLETSKYVIKDFLLDGTNIKPLSPKVSKISSEVSNAGYSSFQPYGKDNRDYDYSCTKNKDVLEKHFSQPYSKILNAIRHRKSASESKKKNSEHNTFFKHSRIHGSRQLQSSYINSSKLNKIISNDENSNLQKILKKMYLESKENEPICLDKDILKKKALLAELDAKCEIALQELKVLGNQELINQNSILSNEIFIATVISKLSISLKNLKNTFQSEIETLILQRNILYEKNAQLKNLWDTITQEVQQLNFKKIELNDLNNRLVQKIQEQFHICKGLDNVHPVGANDLLRNENTKPLPPIITPIPKSTNNDIFDSISYTESLSTPASEKIKFEYTESSDDNSLPKIPSKDESRLPDNKISSWKKGASLTKSIVKGFNKTRLSESNDMYSDCGNTSLSSGLSNLALNDSLSSSNSRHSFSAYTFLRITKCDYCGSKLWGNEMRCLGCGIPCHIKCIGNIVTNCNKSKEYLPYNEDILCIPNSVNLYVLDIFGNDLTKQVQIENRNIPFIVTRCIDEVEKRGMLFEGVYRKSGSTSQIRLLIDAFNHNDIENLSQSKFEDISVVTSVLKQYFRRLPNPLITYKAYKPFLEATASNKSWVEKVKLIKDVLSILPKAHYDCLKFLILHLSRVANYSDKNLMSSKNLAVVFSPTLLRDESGARDIIDIQAKNIGIQYLLDNSNDIFKNSSKEKEYENDDFK
ncbi:hypothetical protein PORY_002620 [Pneumocystis oryctolagi]|uniref:Uncharacterized protein n=1 Tax=Pneumocystis oryctolagi TaxID=42067 RepID=A0ACB7CA97_9ASCO|nr:hypothetical protein PORY_002620 [Pneumocystis oryctolagi]